ncbi:MAG TPA: D-alanyl-D-alanine carboxypeptidase family protein [Thermoanaerobaculia bacterium]|nr:D-alanyl-D-alanine carboxypeptidase family protein [Thermoanaerobaculia bacterium]
MMKSCGALLLISLFALPLLAQSEDFTHSILLEPTTWTVIEQKNAAQAAPIASMTKMMTTLIALEMIRDGKLKWDEPVSVSARASLMGGSQVYLRHREVMPVREMVAAVSIHSANDAALALAEHIAGDEAKFVQMMNQRARELELRETRFYSPHGLPGEGEKPDDVSSPHDLARLAWTLMQFEEAMQMAVVRTQPFRNGQFILYNPNALLATYEHATGLKTGTHNRAGSCVTATAEKDGMTLIAVYLGATQRRQLFQTVRSAFENAFDTYRVLQPVRKGAGLSDALPVAGGRIPAINAVTAASAHVLIKKDEEASISTQVQASNPPAPIEKGERVGWIMVKKNGRDIGRVPLVAVADVPKESWLQVFWDHVWPW